MVFRGKIYAMYFTPTDYPVIPLPLPGGLASAPQIQSQPGSQTALPGQTAVFAVVASGTPSPTYQWYFGSFAIAGATSPTLILGNVQPGAAGNFTVVVSNSLGSVTSGIATLTVNPVAPTITSPLAASGVTGSSFNYQIVANPVATAFTATGLPAGLNFTAGSGTISGVPTQIGVFTVPISAANVTGAASANLTITIQTPPPVITSAAAASGQVGSSFTYTTQATNNPTSYAISTGTLPAGLTLNPSNGSISGTPTQAGTFVVTLTAANRRDRQAVME